jgi:methyl-accepting chemotaxis protein
MRRHDRDATSGLKALGEELKSGIALLAGIEEITERSRLIAFNMAIEAARIGEKGRGFKVIVGELRALNDRTVEFSRKVSDLLGKFKKFNDSLVLVAIESSMSVADEVERGVREEESAIEALVSASSSCEDLSGNVIQAVRSINKELDGVLESLQFQDITRQMIEGAQAAIAEAEADVAQAVKAAPALDRAEERRLVEELRSSLLARSKTRGEKDAIKEVKI